MNNKYKERRDWLAQYYVPENKLEKVKEVSSPSGRYQLHISSYKTRPGAWEVTRGEVYRDGVLVATVDRNYHHFWYCWVENHPDGHDYLLCGEDYQGQTVIQLDTGERSDYFPEAGNDGVGFCWVAVEYEREENKLSVEGCYWAFPFEILTLDFSNPMELPYTELDRRDAYEDDYEEEE